MCFDYHGTMTGSDFVPLGKTYREWLQLSREDAFSLAEKCYAKNHDYLKACLEACDIAMRVHDNMNAGYVIVLGNTGQVYACGGVQEYLFGCEMKQIAKETGEVPLAFGPRSPPFDQQDAAICNNQKSDWCRSGVDEVPENVLALQLVSRV
jgi:hypothetical protein